LKHSSPGQSACGNAALCAKCAGEIDTLENLALTGGTSDSMADVFLLQQASRVHPSQQSLQVVALFEVRQVPQGLVK
jgi:hypothetical protein